MGLALDPDFEKNHFVYLYYTYYEFPNLYNRVSEFTESNNTLLDERVLLDKIPASFIHDGRRIKFGPDGKLYVTTGEAGRPDSAQDLNYLGGKILRINPDGSIPSDNPFVGLPVYSYGNRNPEGLGWDQQTGRLVETEHGPSGEMGYHAHDEINIIEAGENYGWPRVVGVTNDSRYVSPILDTGNVTWAPSGATFYSSDKIAALKGKFLIATLRGPHLEVLTLDKDDKVQSTQEIFQDKFGRLRDVAQGPDGYIYILTSNADGRGLPAADDDKILRVVPEFSSNAVMITVAFVTLSIVLTRFKSS